MKIDFDNSKSGENKVCYLYGNQKAIEDGIDYIESVIEIQSYIDEEHKEIEKLQIEHDTMLNESGAYAD